MSEKKLTIKFVHPPIPNRNFDYAAYHDEEGPTGWGKTEEEAIKNLEEILEDEV